MTAARARAGVSIEQSRTKVIEELQATEARHAGELELVTQQKDAAVAKLAERLAELGAGRVVLNTTADEAFFKKEAGFTPYALTDGSALVTAFIRAVEEE